MALTGTEIPKAEPYVTDLDGRLVVVGTASGVAQLVDTELPAAAALTDADANPTVPGVGAYSMLWDGVAAQWRRFANVKQTADANGGAGLLPIARTLYNGASYDRVRGATVFKSFASTAITAGTGATIWTPTAGKKFRLMGWLISSSVAGQLIFGDNLVGTVIARSEALAAAGVSKEDAMDNGILSAAANNVLKLDGPTGNVAGMVWGTEE